MLKKKYKIGTFFIASTLLIPLIPKGYSVHALSDPYIGLLEYAMKVDVKSAPSSSSQTIASLKFGQSAAFIGEVKGSDGKLYNQVKIRKNGKLLTGYVYNKKFSYGSYFMPYHYDPSFESTVNQFPSSYRQALRYIHSTYPSWKMYRLNVGQDFNAVASYYQSRSNIDTKNSVLITSTTPVEGKNWYRTNLATTKYFLDPRNYLNAYDAVTFNKLDYDSQETLSDILEMFGSSKLSNYASYIVKMAEKYDVSLFNIAARAFGEQGYKGGLGLNGGKARNSDGKTYYNVYNVKANTGAQDGIDYAQTQGWDTVEKSIEGGVRFIKDGYLGQYQWSTYLQKFNVHPSSPKGLWHSYMANIRTPLTEGEKLWKTYSNSSNHLDEKAKKLYIPVYDNMPESKASYPDTSDDYLTNDFVYESDLPKNNSISTIKVSHLKAQLTSENKIKVSFNGVNLAKNYIIEYKENSNSWKSLATISSTTYASSFKLGTKYQFRVKVNGSSEYVYSNNVYTLGQITSFNVSKYSNSQVKLSWNKPNNVHAYYIMQNGKVVSWANSQTTSKVLTVTAGNNYTYSIYPYLYSNGVKVDGTTRYKSYTLVNNYLKDKKVTGLNAKLYGYRNIRISFNKVNGASQYFIQYKRKSWKTWHNITTTSSNTYYQANRAENADYQYRVKVIGSNYYVYSSVIYTMGKTNTPYITKRSYNQITMSWNKINGAHAYEIFRNGKYYAWASGKQTSIALSASRYRNYKYQIRAYNYYNGKRIYAPLSNVRSYTLK